MPDDGHDVREGVRRQVVRQAMLFAADRHERVGKRSDLPLDAAMAPCPAAEAPQTSYQPGQIGLGSGVLVISVHRPPD